MTKNVRVCFVFFVSFAVVATLGAQVKPSDKLATSSSTISGIMVKPTAAVAAPSTPALPTSAANTAAAAEAAKKSPLASFEDMDEADQNDEDDQEDQMQAIPQPSSQSATLLPSATSSDLKTAAGYHYPSHHEGGHHGGHHYGKYYQYASVPYPYAWEFGYRRGNPYHTIERHEKGKGSHFHTKVKWNDKHAGYGVHVWDYNHDDHHSGHYGGGHHGTGHDSYGHHGSSHHGHGYGGHH